MPVDLATVLRDLATEEEDLAEVLVGLGAPEWERPTPSVGWAVRDQVAHLAEGEELAALALTDEEGFAGHLTALLADLEGTMAAMAARARAGTGDAVRQRWEAARHRTLEALRERSPEARIPWVSGLMSLTSFATARLMETWAHGQDVRDALRLEHPPSARLRHVAHLGVATRGFSFANRGLPVPPEPRVVLVGPAGETWTWGPEDAAERVSGPVRDFCLVVTQRRHPLDTALTADGEGARHWLTIAQAFAGPPTDGPDPSH